MATPIKDTPRLTGKNAEEFLNNLVNHPKKVSKKELDERLENFNKLEQIRKF